MTECFQAHTVKIWGSCIFKR